jgi:hypothetical protein
MATCISGEEGNRRNAQQRKALYVLSVPYLLACTHTQDFYFSRESLENQYQPIES